MDLPLESIVSRVDLPVIDISNFPQDVDADDLSLLRDHPVLAQLKKACKEWGFFRLVNHGIPVDLLQKAENVCRELLSIPTASKERILTTSSFDAYYRTQKHELFYIPDSTNPASIAKMYAKICPDGDPSFCETMSAFALSVSNLEKKITKMILASLGLDANAFYHSHFEKRTAVFRINGYPSENISIGEEAIVSHTDIGCLTILCQDDAGGLEIRSQDGEWVNVKPLPNSFLVFVGDSIKAWSNGRYHSAEHHVVYNGWRDRISFGFFTAFTDDTEIWAPEELVDEENPRRYKPFIYSHLKQDVTRKENREKATTLEKVAGI